jgi:hypothetical protein
MNAELGKTGPSNKSHITGSNDTDMHAPPSLRKYYEPEYSNLNHHEQRTLGFVLSIPVS